MNDAERWLKRLDEFREELEGIHMLLDEMLHVLRRLQRDGIEVSNSHSRWCNDGRKPSTAESLQMDTEDDDTDGSAELQGSKTQLPAAPDHLRTRLFD